MDSEPDKGRRLIAGGANQLTTLVKRAATPALWPGEMPRFRTLTDRIASSSPAERRLAVTHLAPSFSGPATIADANCDA